MEEPERNTPDVVYGRRKVGRARTCRRPMLESVRSRLHIQVIRFSVVGVINTAVDLAVLNALIAITNTGRAGLTYTAYKTISFLVAVLNSFIVNSRWTFGATEAKAIGVHGCQFLLVSVIALLINVTSASYVANVVRPIIGLEHYWPSLAALTGTACGLFSNFLGYKYFVFAPNRANDRLA